MILISKCSWTTVSALEKMPSHENGVGMAMDADAVINQAQARRINGSFSRIDHSSNTGELLRYFANEETLIYLFLIDVSERKDPSFDQNHNTWTLQKADMSLPRLASDNLIARWILSFCALFKSSFFPDDLLHC